ncbi:MAG TPA: protein kinase [Acidobacteriota bacterium]
MTAAKTIGDYELRELLRSLPESDVYKAWDKIKRRWVSIRLIHPGDAQTAQQIQGQAETTAGLHHQDIAAIYRVDKEGDTTFIVSEYVDGEPVLNWLQRQHQKPQKVIGLGLQIAEALRYAHGQGLLHGALNPSAILITKGEQVKLLDIGVAPVAAAELKSDQVTQTLGATDPALQMTMLPYMSPEQARGESLDGRSDLFSMGAVLYQMTTGVLPFGGETPQQVLHKIYNSSLEPITKFTVDFPPRWEHVLNKLLEKDRTQRYQTADEFIHDAAALANRVSRIEKTRHSAIYLVLLVALLGAIGFVFRNDWYRLRPTSVKPQVTPLIPNGTSESQPHAALDGQLVVYVSDRGGNPDLWLLDRRNSRPRQVLSTPEEEAWPSLSPDGNLIVFVRYPVGRRDSSLAQIFTVSREGGSEKKIADSANYPVWSPDGTEIVFSKFGPNGESRIASAAASNPASWHYLTGSGDGPLPHSAPALSPDGKSIAYTAGIHPASIWVKDLDGAARPLRADTFNNQFPVWDPRQERIVYSSTKGGSSNIWSIGLEPNAAARQLTSLHKEIGRVALAGNAVFFEQSETNYEIHISDLANGRDKLAISSHNRLGGISWNGPGQITYVNIRSRPEIWETNLSGESSKAIMADKHSNSQGVWSPDGSSLAFVSDRSGSREIWIWKRAVTKTEQLTSDGAPKQDIAWSEDGNYIAYVRQQGARGEIWIFDFASHQSHRLLTAQDAARPIWSPDGQWIYYQGKTKGSPPQIFRIPSQGGTPHQVCKDCVDPSLSASGDLVFLTADGRALQRLPKNQNRASSLLSAPPHSTLLEAKIGPDGKTLLYLALKRDSEISFLSFGPF